VSSTRTEEDLSRGRTGKFAVVVAVGPDQKEPERVLDLIDSLEAFEAGSYDFILVDDQQAGLLANPRIWLPTPLVEDLTISICTKAVDFRLKDMSGEAQAFAVRYRGLPAAPEKLNEDGRSVIHSVKDFEDLEEVELRAYFRRLRKQPAFAGG
jgi:hypothetical protein